MLGCFLNRPFIEIHHPLVTSVHEVDLHSFNAPLCKLCKESRVLLNTTPGQPKYDSNTYLISMSDDLKEVTVRIWCIRIHVILCPAFIHHYILDSVTRSKVHKIFICLNIQSRNKIHIRAIRHRTIPPFPTCLTRNNPRQVIQLAILCKATCHCGLQKACILLGDHEISPREVSCTGCLCNIFLTQIYIHRLIMNWCLLRWNSMKDRHQTISFITSEEWSRIVNEIRLAHKDLCTTWSHRKNRIMSHLAISPVLGCLMERVWFLV